MKLSMTKQQCESLEKHSSIRTEELQRVFKQSCEDQEKLKQRASQTRRRQRRIDRLKGLISLKFLRRKQRHS